MNTVFLIQSLNNDFNIRRLESYLIVAWERGAQPVVVLTKSDCCHNVTEKMEIVYSTAPGVNVHAISCITDEGIDEIQQYLVPGNTVALLGSSGVGKSTLANKLLGLDVAKTQEIREHQRWESWLKLQRELAHLDAKKIKNCDSKRNNEVSK